MRDDHPRHGTRPVGGANLSPERQATAIEFDVGHCLGFGKPVSTVAGFGQGVGAKAEPSIGSNDVFDHRGILDGVDVVHALGAFIAEKLRFVKVRGAFHYVSLVRKENTG